MPQADLLPTTLTAQETSSVDSTLNPVARIDGVLRSDLEPLASGLTTVHQGRDETSDATIVCTYHVMIGASETLDWYHHF